MDANEKLLQLYGILLATVLVAVPVVAYLRRRADLVTAHSAFLLGGAIFVGLSCLECADRFYHFRPYSRNIYLLFMFSATFFFVVYLLAHRGMSRARRVGERLFQSWPAPSWLVTLTVVGLCVAILGARYLPPVPVVSSIILQLNEKAIPFMVVVAFTAWYRDKINPVMATVTLGAVGFAMVASVVIGGSRRTFLGVLLAIPICYYWYRGRYRSPKENLMLGGGALLLIGVVLTAYSVDRWFDLGRDARERNVGTAVEHLSNTLNAISQVDLAGEIGKLGQNATEVSLYCIWRTSVNDPAPFESIYAALVNPIPRALWPDKPVVLGRVLVVERLGPKAPVNWGPGIVGHAYHEGGLLGGLPMLAFYAVFFAFFIQVADGCIVSQPNNPFIIGGLTAAASHLIVLLRGDMSVGMLQLIGTVVLILIVQGVTLVVFGAQRPQRGPVYVRQAAPT